jgi:hypothetical protein
MSYTDEEIKAWDAFIESIWQARPVESIHKLLKEIDCARSRENQLIIEIEKLKNVAPRSSTGLEQPTSNRQVDGSIPSGEALTSAQCRISELERERDDARDEASDMRDEAYIDASAEKPISWQSMHEAECAARHAALADLAAAQSRIRALEEALKPFADMGANPDLNDVGWKDQSCQWIDCIEFDPCATVGDLRRARSTLSSPQKEGE